MSGTVLLLSYGAAFLIAALLLWRFPHIRWYWHAAALVLAMGLGLMPPIEELAGPAFDVLLGMTFLFLVVWGIGEAVCRALHVHRHA